MILALRTLPALTALCLLQLTMGLEVQAQTRSAVTRGEAIAAEACAGCHRGGTTIQGAAVPSFEALAAKANLTPERLKDAIATPRHPMPAIPLRSADIDSLVAYIRSLK